MGKILGKKKGKKSQGGPAFVSYPTQSGIPMGYPSGAVYPSMGMQPMAQPMMAQPMMAQPMMMQPMMAQPMMQPMVMQPVAAQPTKKGKFPSGVKMQETVKGSVKPGSWIDYLNPLAWIPCTPYARRLQSTRVKIRTGYKPDRWPTDILCLFLFVLLWVGMIILAVFGVWSGNPLSLLLPTDYQDNVCGYEKGEGNYNLYDLSSKPVLWYPFSFDKEFTNTQFIDALYMGVCVEECPTTYLGESYINVLSNFAVYRPSITEDMIICNYNIGNITLEEKLDHIEARTGCHVNIFPTTTFQKRCVPDLNANLNFTLPGNVQFYIDSFLKTGNILKAGFYEVRIAWFPLVITGFTVLGICFLIAFFVNTGFLKLFATVAIIVAWMVMVGFTGFCGWAAYDRWVNATVNGITSNTTRGISIFFMVLGGIFLILDLLYICVVLFLIRRIKKAADIIQLAARPLFKIPTLLLVPIVTFFFLCCITAYWLIIAGYIQSATLPISLTVPELGDLPVGTLPFNTTASYTIRRGDATIQGFQWYHLFGYIWSAAFISAIGYTTTAGVVAQWYFSAKGNPEANYANKGSDYQKRSETLSVLRSFLRAVIFHSGSLLFGSILVAIVQMIRFIYRKIESYLTKIFALATCGNPAIVALIICVRCCIRFLLFGFYLLVKFFNKNAYIMMMIHGGNFLNSGARAFNLIKSNIVLVGTTNFLGHAMLLLIQCVVTIWGGFQTYLTIYLFNRYNARLVMGEVDYYVVPVLVGLAISFIISGMFVNMYTTAIDTVILCYLEDKKVRKNYPYTPPPLRDSTFFQMLTPPFINHARYLIKQMNKKAKKKMAKKNKNVEA